VKISVHMDRKEDAPITEWEEFLAQARRSGASDTTPVLEEFENDDPYRPRGWVIEVEQGDDPAPPENVILPTDLVHDLIFVATEVANGDGDVRGLEVAARRVLDQLNEHFRSPALGPSPWTSKDDDEDEE
jgi:hypothetical protein